MPRDGAPAARLSSDASIEDIARASLGAGLDRLVTNDPFVRAHGEAEAVHQARVATRRLRSDLRTLRPALDREWTNLLRAELKWFGELLGRVRDADVLATAITERAERLPPGRHARSASLVRRLEEHRSDDLRALRDAMSSDRYTAILDQLVDAIREPERVLVPDHDRTGKRAVRELAEKQWKRLRREVGALGETPADVQLHEVRKRAKQARYAYEATAPVSGSAADKTADALADLQDVLGAHQDAVVAVEWLFTTALASDDQQEAFIAGELSSSFANERQELRGSWAQYWKRARRAHQRI